MRELHFFVVFSFLILAVSSCSHKTIEQTYSDRLCNCVSPFLEGIRSEKQTSISNTFDDYYNCFRKLKSDSFAISAFPYFADSSNAKYVNENCDISWDDLRLNLGFYSFSEDTDFVSKYHAKSDSELLEFYKTFDSQIPPLLRSRLE